MPLCCAYRVCMIWWTYRVWFVLNKLSSVSICLCISSMLFKCDLSSMLLSMSYRVCLIQTVYRVWCFVWLIEYACLAFVYRVWLLNINACRVCMHNMFIEYGFFCVNRVWFLWLIIEYVCLCIPSMYFQNKLIEYCFLEMFTKYVFSKYVYRVLFGFLGCMSSLVYFF